MPAPRPPVFHLPSTSAPTCAGRRRCRVLSRTWADWPGRAPSLQLHTHLISLPFSSFSFHTDIPGFHARRLSKYGRVYRSHALGAPLTCIADAAQVRRLLLGEAGAAPITATDWTPAVRALLGPESLLMKSGPAHAASRRILAQAFTGAAVDSYQPLVRDATERAVAAWAEETAEAGSITAIAAGKDLAFEIAARALIAGTMDQPTMDAFREDFDLFTLGFFGIVSFFGFGAERERGGAMHGPCTCVRGRARAGECLCPHLSLRALSTLARCQGPRWSGGPAAGGT